MVKVEHSVKENYFYNLFYQILSMVVPFITTPYISRVLGAENVGIYSFVYASTTYFTLIGVNGLPTYAQFEVARLRDDENELKQFFTEAFVTKMITMSISILVYIGIYIIRPNTYHIYYLIQLSVLVSNLIDVTWVFQGVEDFKTIAIRNSIVRILSVIAILIFIRSSEDLYLYFIINGCGTLVGYVSVFPGLKKYVSFGFLQKPNIIKHIKSSIPYFLPAIASVLISTTDKLMIGWDSSNKVQNGYYEQAVKVENMIFLVFGSLNISLRPRMAYLFKNKQYDEIKERMKASLRFVSLLVFPIAMGLIAVSDIFVPVFFGQGYLPVAGLLRIMAFWIICKAISNCLCEQYILPNMGPIIATRIIWGSAIINIAFNLLLIPRFEAVGAAVASLITEVVFFGIVYFVARNAIGIMEYVKGVWKYIIASGIMFFILWRLRLSFSADIIGMILEIGIGTIIYFLMLLLFQDEFVFEQIKRIYQMLDNKLRGRK